jgi:hypothetical protein
MALSRSATVLAATKLVRSRQVDETLLQITARSMHEAWTKSNAKLDFIASLRSQ